MLELEHLLNDLMFNASKSDFYSIRCATYTTYI